MTDISGLAASVDRLDRKVAPAKAPIAPGTPSFQTNRQSTLPSFQWESPEATLVPISARCTDALAIAGLSPTKSNSDEEVTP